MLLPISIEDIGFGKKLWNAVRDDPGFPAEGAFWIFQTDPDDWRLFIATRLVDEEGSRRAYSDLSPFLQRVEADAEQQLRIVLISPNASLFQALRSLFRGKNINGQRLTHTVLGGTYIDGAYIYEIR